MNGHDFDFAGARLTALPSGALWWAGAALLCISDLHLGKSERIARRGGGLLPPFDGHETLMRLDADIRATCPRTVICLGDSFDDLEAARGLAPGLRDWITRLAAGRHWIWITGNHDAGPVDLAGTHLDRVTHAPLGFCHIATPDGRAEVSGHYHPKARLMTRAGPQTRRCFLHDDRRLILPAYGAYTGGLYSHDPALAGLMGQGARAILLNTPPLAVPMPR